MSKVPYLIRAPLALTLFAALAAAAPIDIDDGTLTDWGVTVADNNGSTITGYGVADWVTAGGNAADFLGADFEDQNDNSNSYFLGPNSGGQNYDAELLAAVLQGGKLHIAISTGQRPDNGSRYFSPGDIRFELSDGTTLGVEVGGGEGGGPGGTITEGSAGSTYVLNGSGYTTGHISGLTVGGIYEGSNWILDPIAPNGAVQINHLNPGTQVGTADYSYSRDDFTNQHAIIELAIDLSVFGGDLSSLDSIHWRPSCGNDEVNLSIQLNPVPEPGSLLLLAPAAVIFYGLRRRKNR